MTPGLAQRIRRPAHSTGLASLQYHFWITDQHAAARVFRDSAYYKGYTRRTED
jgi:hypothetical protein